MPLHFSQIDRLGSRWNALGIGLFPHPRIRSIVDIWRHTSHSFTYTIRTIGVSAASSMDSFRHHVCSEHRLVKGGGELKRIFKCFEGAGDKYRVSAALLWKLEIKRKLFKSKKEKKNQIKRIKTNAANWFTVSLFEAELINKLGSPTWFLIMLNANAMN